VLTQLLVEEDAGMKAKFALVVALMVALVGGAIAAAQAIGQRHAVTKPGTKQPSSTWSKKVGGATLWTRTVPLDRPISTRESDEPKG